MTPCSPGTSTSPTVRQHNHSALPAAAHTNTTPNSGNALTPSPVHTNNHSPTLHAQHIPLAAVAVLPPLIASVGHVVLWSSGPETPDTRTATFSLAIDATTRANGCLRFVDGSHLEPSIRPHRPVAEDREKAHAIMCQVDERSSDNPNGELVSYVEVNRGDVTVHNEKVVGADNRHTARGGLDEWLAGCMVGRLSGVTEVCAVLFVRADCSLYPVCLLRS